MPTGIFSNYYENGKPKTRIDYSQAPDGLYVYAYSADGVDLIPKGNGMVESDGTAGKSHFTEFVDYHVFGSFSVNTLAWDTVYTRCEKLPEFDRGSVRMAMLIRQR
ncbi:MAG TPA: hypothetical protein VEB86_03270 [Chryseosolibacter sp.]|nr:hypothetical protein [Chryseosolibacter sp.]